MQHRETCKISGCGRPILNKSKGWCSLHYQRWSKYGDPSISKLDRSAPTGSPCNVDGCERPRVSRGLCSLHYNRMVKNGDPLKLHDRHRRLERWLMAHVAYVGDDCLIWPFSVGDHGRGSAVLNGTRMSAPRIMCMLAHGEPPTPEHEAAHNCGNGHLGCIHPGHLEWKTRVQNEADKRLHGTLRRGDGINTSKLSAEDVQEIRKLRGKVAGRELAKRFGVSATAISGVQLGRTWGWLP